MAVIILHTVIEQAISNICIPTYWSFVSVQFNAFCVPFIHSFSFLHCCVCNLSRNVHTHQFTFIWTYESWRKTSKRHNKNQVYEGRKRLNETTNDNKANPIGGHKQWIERNNDTSHAQRYRFGSSLNSCELFILWIYIKTDCAKERKVFFINIKTEFKSEMLVSSLCRPNRI